MKRGNITRSIIILILSVASLFIIACQRGQPEDSSEALQMGGQGTEAETWDYPVYSMFSWEAEIMEAVHSEELNMAMSRLGCTAVFQEIKADSDKELVKEFLTRQAESGYEVYGLAGDAEWGLDGDCSPMEDVLQFMADVNGELGAEKGFKGIVWDIEPYLTDAWDEKPDVVMAQYVDHCVELYQQAGDANLKTILCIPYFYDQQNFVEQLERLIADGCDGVAIMNYYKKDEIGQIKNEEYLTRKHGKVLIQITELQKEGRHELTEENTYYRDGIPAVQRSWKKIKEAFPDGKIGFSYHYLKPVLELLEREE